MQYYNIVKQKNVFTLHKYFRDPTILAVSCCLKSIHQHTSEIWMSFLEFVDLLLSKKETEKQRQYFPDGGANTKDGRQTYYLAKCFWKTAFK